MSQIQSVLDISGFVFVDMWQLKGTIFFFLAPYIQVTTCPCVLVVAHDWRKKRIRIAVQTKTCTDYSICPLNYYKLRAKFGFVILKFTFRSTGRISIFLSLSSVLCIVRGSVPDWYGSGCGPVATGSGPDPAFFVSFSQNFQVYSFLKVHLHHSLKSHWEVTK
jgi:hypothetical protein